MLPSINNTNNIENEKKKDKKEKKEKKEKKKNRSLNLKNSARYCSICFEEIQDASCNYSITPCNHAFCTTCLLQYSKYNNNCPLCRKDILSPHKKFKLGFHVANKIIREELYFYKDYIKDGSNFLIDAVEYHVNNSTLDDDIKCVVHNEIVKMFENFGRGICLNVNTTFKKYNVFNGDSPLARNTENSFNNLETENTALENTIVDSVNTFLPNI